MLSPRLVPRLSVENCPLYLRRRSVVYSARFLPRASAVKYSKHFLLDGMKHNDPQSVTRLCSRAGLRCPRSDIDTDCSGVFRLVQMHTPDAHIAGQVTEVLVLNPAVVPGKRLHARFTPSGSTPTAGRRERRTFCPDRKAPCRTPHKRKSPCGAERPEAWDTASATAIAPSSVSGSGSFGSVTSAGKLLPPQTQLLRYPAPEKPQVFALRRRRASSKQRGQKFCAARHACLPCSAARSFIAAAIFVLLAAAAGARVIRPTLIFLTTG